MSEPFLGEIRLFGFNFAPRGWAMCDGQILPINQNQSLYSILGTTYGGDGRTTFALPDLRGRLPMHATTSFPQGSKGGAEQHVLSVAEMPAHAHAVRLGTNAASQSAPQGYLAQHTGEGHAFAAPAHLTEMAPTLSQGGSQPHENRQPYGVVNFCIALQGLFPSRS